MSLTFVSGQRHFGAIHGRYRPPTNLTADQITLEQLKGNIVKVGSSVWPISLTTMPPVIGNGASPPATSGRLLRAGTVPSTSPGEYSLFDAGGQPSGAASLDAIVADPRGGSLDEKGEPEELGEEEQQQGAADPPLSSWWRLWG